MPAFVLDDFTSRIADPFGRGAADVDVVVGAFVAFAATPVYDDGSFGESDVLTAHSTVWSADLAAHYVGPEPVVVSGELWFSVARTVRARRATDGRAGDYMAGFTLRIAPEHAHAAPPTYHLMGAQGTCDDNGGVAPWWYEPSLLVGSVADFEPALRSSVPGIFEAPLIAVEIEGLRETSADDC